MSKEELLLIYWRELSTDAQDKLLETARLLTSSEEDEDLGAPEHLKVRSQEHLEELLNVGLDSLEKGYGIEVTDEWFDQERQKLIDRFF
jgi:hypothetical protein